MPVLLMSKLRILLADDHRILREGLRLLIQNQPDMECIGEAAHGAEAVQKSRELQPDIVLMDLTMPGLNGLQATRLILSERPQTKILALTGHEDESYLRQFAQARACGYVLKRYGADELLKAIRTVGAGGVYFDGTLAAKALAGQAPLPHAQTKSRSAELSEREKEVVILVAWGYSHKEIGDRIGVSGRTVETYRARINKKLGLRTRTDVVRFALREGWLKDAPGEKRAA